MLLLAVMQETINRTLFTMPSLTCQNATGIKIDRRFPYARKSGGTIALCSGSCPRIQGNSEVLIKKAGRRFDAHLAPLKVNKEIKMTTLRERMNNLWTDR
jgi:hypothetical protein